MPTITPFDVFDIRFPTSRTRAGSDAMHRDADRRGEPAAGTDAP